MLHDLLEKLGVGLSEQEEALFEEMKAADPDEIFESLYNEAEETRSKELTPRTAALTMLAMHDSMSNQRLGIAAMLLGDRVGTIKKMKATIDTAYLVLTAYWIGVKDGRDDAG